MRINKKQIAYNRTPRTQKPVYIVIHDTGNTGKGANAKAHFNYFNGGNNLAVDGPMLQGNVVDAHPEHHAKAHDKGEQQALSFVDRHKGHCPFCVTPRHHATKTGGQDGAVGTSSRPPVVRASATTYVVKPA